MKIALVSPYDFAYPGGVVNHISQLERYLTRMGHEVKIIAPASKAVNNCGDWFIPIGRPRAVPASGSIARITLSLRLASRIKEVLEREKFDVVHLHEPFMIMLCSAILRFSKSVNIGTFHASEATPGYNFGWPIGRMVLKRRARKLHGKIAVSRPAKEYAEKYVPGTYEIIPNGIDLEHFQPDVPPIQEYCDGKLNILFVGRLERRKGVNYLIKAYARIKADYPDSRLIVVGPGTRPRRKHEKSIKASRLKDVVLTGPVSYNDLVRYYRTADICCAPATGKESFGIVLLEAMALGKPVVASNISGYASVMTDGKEGILVPPRDVGQLAQALGRLMADEKLRREMGARGRLTAADYSWEHVASRVADYYRKIMDEAGATGQRPRYEAASMLV
jgi:phosphatidylinositol alpha-mannosyltransferase